MKPRIALGTALLAALVGGLGWAAAHRSGLLLPAYERRMLPLVRAVGARTFFDARLGGGFRTGPRNGIARDASTAADVGLLSAAAQLEAEARREAAPDALRALGAAHLILGSHDEAVRGFERLTRDAPHWGGAWSDLAAAYLVRSRNPGRSADRPRALECALRATELERSSEALLNLAHALDAMHLPDQARTAWAEALSIETDPDWQADIAARSRDREAPDTLDRDAFLERVSRAAIEGDHAEVERLARESSEGFRFWFNTRGLAAAATEEGRKSLALLGPVLNSALKDPDIPDTIAQVLSLPPSSAGALQLFAEIAGLHQNNRWGEAEKPLALLRGSRRLPTNLARWREWYEGVTELQHGETERARARFEALIETTPEAAQPFLKAHAHYRRSVIASSGGQPDLAIRHRAETSRLFARAGEPGWVAFAGQQIGEVHGKLGLTDVDWDARIETLRLAPRLFNRRSSILAMTIVGDDLVRSELPRSAAVVYRAAHERAVALDLKDSAADTALGVASALRSTDPPAAREAALVASRMASAIEDPLLRARMSGEALRVRASLEPGNEVLMSEALAWLGKRGSWGRQIPLMTAHGLALAASGRIESAKKTLLAGAELYEANRPRDLELSDAGSDQIRPAYAALAEIEARAGGEAGALEDLARRYWTAAGNVPGPEARADSPQGCALAFVPSPTGILSWLTCGKVTRFHLVDVGAAERKALVDDFVAARRSGRAHEKPGRRLFDLLLAPWEPEISGAGALTLAAADELARLPFAALPLGDGTELGSRTALIHSPAPIPAPAFAEGSNWSAPLIVTAAPDGPEFPRLPHAWKEAADLAGELGGRFLHRDQATAENTLASLREADFFYFAGHALVNASRPFDSSLVLVDSTNRPSFLTVRRLLALDLRGLKLAVLAGCSTAEAGKLGSMSLAGAFLAAGARSVVATLWPVPDDAMSRLMPRFFDHLEAEGSPSRALLRLRNDPAVAASDRPVVDALAVSELARTSSKPSQSH